MYKSAISMLYDLATVPDAKKGSSQQQFTGFVINFLSSLLTVPVSIIEQILLNFKSELFTCNKIIAAAKPYLLLLKEKYFAYSFIK